MWKELGGGGFPTCMIAVILCDHILCDMKAMLCGFCGVLSFFPIKLYLVGQERSSNQSHQSKKKTHHNNNKSGEEGKRENFEEKF